MAINTFHKTIFRSAKQVFSTFQSNYFPSALILFGLLFSTNSFAQTYTMGTSPAGNGATISTCSGTFLDPGGASNYSANQNFTVTFTSANSGNQLKLLFSSIAIGAGDTLRIYNGTSTSAALLYQFNPGTSLSNWDVNSYVNGSLTVWFKSNATTQAAGWSATISCLAGCSNTYSICNGTTINWMESGTGTGIGTLRFCNLPNTSTHAYNLMRDQSGVYTYFSGDYDANIINNTFTENNVAAGRNAYFYDAYIRSPWTMICQEKMVLDFGCPSLNLLNTKVSNCYLVGGVSKYTVCTEVKWFGAKNGDSIVVNVGGNQKVIKTDRFISNLGLHDAENNGPPYTPALQETQLVSSQEICAEINASTSGTILATFPKAGIGTSLPFSTPPPCPIATCTGGMLGGTVFEDFNADGIKQTGEYSGVANVTITIFGKDGTVYGPLSSDMNGKFMTTIPASNYPVRVEFSTIPVEFGGGFSTMNGTDGRTTVQFIQSPDCNVDLGVTSSSSYSQTLPYVISPIYKNGDPLQNGTTKNTSALLAFPQSSSGDTAANTFTIKADKVGSLWGQAYNRKTKKLFSAAFLRRHTGLGPGGYDAIYVTDISNINAPSVPVYFNLSSKGINVGTVPSNSIRQLPANLNQPSLDTIGGVYQKICSQGIGGIDISDDGSTMFLVNVKDNTLHKINLLNYNTSNNLNDITLSSTYTIPSMGCIGGVQKSFACKFYKGKVYVGSICNGATSNKTNLRASVFEFNLTTSTFTEILNFPLTYTKGPTAVNMPNTSLEMTCGWDNWHDDYKGIYNLIEPVFMDIELDIDGALVLGFGDRKAFQLGYNNFLPDGTFGGQNAGGDILRAVKYTNGGYMLENNAKVAGVTGYGPNNSQGPGLGEFYNDDTWADGTLIHSETALGGLAIQPGSGTTISSHMDPITTPQIVNQWYYSGGVRWYNNQSGIYSKGYQTYVSSGTNPPSDGTFSKAAGMGDVELVMDLPQYLEIGNFVWLDQDNDGIQDPTEVRIPGVNVSLYKGSTLIATTVTNSNGEYYFSRASRHTGGTWSGTGADTTLLISTSYNIVFGTSGQYVSGVLNASSNGKMFLTQANTGQGSVPDQNDNDALIQSVAGGSYPAIAVTTGDYQYVNHTFDAGFKCLDIGSISLQKTAPTCNSSFSNNNGLLILNAGVNNAIKYRIRLGSDWIGASDTSFTTATVIGSSFPLTIQNNIPNSGATYIIRFYGGDLCYKDTTVTIDPVNCACVANAGPDVFLNCTTSSAVIGTAGNAVSYSWSPSSGLSATNIPQPTASPSTTTTYILTVDGICKDTVVVNVNNTPPVANAGSPVNLNCTTTSGTIGTAAIAGNTYTWLPATNLSSSSLAQPIASPTSTTTYTVTVTGSNGCTATSTVTVNVNTTSPVANSGSTLTLNCNTTSGTIGTTAIAGLLYSWTPSSGLNVSNIAQPIASPTVTTTYTVTASSSNGCTATSTVLVNVNNTPPLANAGPDKQIDCLTTTTVIGTTSISGNTYSWSPASGLNSIIIAQPTANPNATTTYTVTVTNSFTGCSATSSVTVNVDATPPAADAGLNQHLNCTTTSAMIGTTPIAGVNYVWNPSTALSSTTIAQPIANPLVTTNYTVTVTATNGCTSTDIVVVNVDHTIPIANAGSNLNLTCNATSGTIGTTVIAGNSYTWSPSTGLSSTSIAQPIASPVTTTIYTVTVTGSNGCTSTSSVTVNVNTTPPIANAGIDKTLTCINTSTLIGSSAVSGVTYAWSPATGLSSATNAIVSANPTSTTTYTLIATGTNGCTASDTVTVNVNTTPPIVDAGASNVINCNIGFHVIGSTAVSGYSYAWSPFTTLSSNNIAMPTANPTSTTTYTLSVTGSNGCVASGTVTLVVDIASPVANAGGNLNLNCSITSGMIETIATAGNTYAWSPSTGLSSTSIAQPIASPGATTIYTLTVTGSNGCTATSTVTVNVNTTSPIANAGSDLNLDCTTTSGTIGTTAIAGNTYAWSPSTGLSSTSIAQPIASPGATTIYTVTVTGSNGCTSTSTVTVNVNTIPPIADAGNNLNLDCSTTSGTIGTTAIAGNSYAWSPATGLSSTSIAKPIASPNATTIYTLTVTGSNGCTSTSTVTVNVNTIPPIADAGNNLNLDCNTISGTIGTTALAGSTYAWSPSTGLSSTSVAQPIASPTATTIYTVTVTGSNGCTSTSTVTVNVNTIPPIANAGSDLNLDCSTTSGTIGTSAIAGNSYAWSPATGLSSTSIAQPIASPNATTIYTLTVTGSNGCTSTSTVTVNVNTIPPIADAGNNLNLDCSTTSGTIGTAAIAGNSYAWSPATGLSSTSIAQPIASPNATTIYTLTVTGSNGCTATSTVTVNVNTIPPIANAGSNLNLDCNTISGSIGTTAIIGNSYTWSPSTGLSSTSVAQPIASPVAITIYTLTVTGSNGCTATSTVTVNVNTNPPIADAGNNLNLDCSTTSGEIGTTSITGNSYAWSPSTGLSSATIAQPIASPNATTIYTLTVTGVNGCTSTSTVTVNVNTIPPIADAGNNLNLDCNTTSGSIGTTAIAGNSYAWSPSTGLSSATIAQPIASPNATTIYTLTVTGTNGCTTSSTVSVNVNTTPPMADAGSDQLIDCITTNATIGTTAIAGNTYSWSPSFGLNATNVAQPSSTASITTTYTVTVTSANGCTASDVVTVNVSNNVPISDAGPTKTINCTISNVVIGTTAISGNTYLWTPATGLSSTNLAQPTANPGTTTSYTLTVTAISGCTSSSTVTVDVDTTPPQPFITGNLIVCNGSMTILTASGGSHYLWSNTDTTSGTSVGAGTYTVTVTASNGCSSNTTATVHNVQGSIGNYVWFDANRNGLNDEPGSNGINGIQVELWKETSPSSGSFNLDQTTSTSTNSGLPGYYQFVVCESANYFVKFPTSHASEVLTLQTTTTATDDNSDANTSDGKSPVFAIDVANSGILKDNNTIDAGYFTPPACLGNYVWNDMNEDGIQNNQEVGVAGITVTLFDQSNNVFSSTITDAYGLYKFCNLMPGVYHVSFTLPANYLFTSANSGNNDSTDSDVDPPTVATSTYTISAGDNNMTIDAGIYFEQASTASVGNYVWFDTNHDGIQDSGETGISGVTVTLYNQSGNTIATTFTDANGFYIFTDVPPGTYQVGFLTPVGLEFSPNNGPITNPSNSDVNLITGLTATFNVNAGDQITYVDAGLFSQAANNAALGDRVWYDINQNGIQDKNENGVEGILVTLYDESGLISLSTTTTDAYGNYIFNQLAAGNYVIGFSNLPVNYAFTTTSGIDSTTNSDANNVSGKTPLIQLNAGQYNMTYDAGIYNSIQANNNSLGNYVWNDVNKNGIQDISESGVAGVTVTLYDQNNSILSSTSTDANGLYLFPNLANGIYHVGFSNIPPGFVFSATGQGTSSTDNDADPSTGLTLPVTLNGNMHNMTIDAGINLGNQSIGLGTLGDLVWYDLNNNGLQDTGESGVADITVTLYQQDGVTVIATTKTDALGNYIFTGLISGYYVVGFSNIPSGFTISNKHVDGQGINGELNSDANTATLLTDQIALGQGEDKMSIDMGIVPPSGSASLGNFVWIDLNHDGLQNIGEPGVQGVGVTLYDAADNMIGNTTTDANGEYYFIGLTPDTYSIGFDNLPQGYSFTTKDANSSGLNDALNSDADTINGLTNTITLVTGDNNLNIDAGIVSSSVASVGDFVWYDLNRDGIQDNNEPGLGGVLVTLIDQLNNPVANTITKPDGSYIFTNVAPGNYTMSFSNLPFGMEFTIQETNPLSNSGSNVNPLSGTTPSFVVLAGTHNPTIDAGLKTPYSGGLGNFVWHDVNVNGLQDAGEPGVAGVIVHLYDSDGVQLLATAVTDGNGMYSFTNLPDGFYKVGFSNLPLGTTRTYNLGVLDDPLNNDLLSDGKTDVAAVINGNYNPNVDAGIYYGIPLTSKSLVAISAELIDQNSCKIYWYTEEEMNTKLFRIERSMDGINFETIGTANANGSTQGRTNYAYLDDISTVNKYQLIYYRIALIDIDDQKMHSNIVMLKPLNSSGEVLIYPIPFDNQLLIEYPSLDETIIDITLSDQLGRTIRNTTRNLNSGMNILQLNELSALSSGTYFIRITDENTGEIFIQKVIK